MTVLHTNLSVLIIVLSDKGGLEIFCNILLRPSSPVGFFFTRVAFGLVHGGGPSCWTQFSKLVSLEPCLCSGQSLQLWS